MPLPTFFNLPEEKRQGILNCAIDEFAQHDYQSASITKIAARAGIAKGSFYQYFADKSDLYHYLLEYAAQKKAELLASSAPRASELGLYDSLRWLFHEMAKYQLVYPKLAQIGLRAAYGRSPLPEELVSQAARSTREYFYRLIEAGKPRGEVRPEIDSELAAFIFTAALTELPRFLSPQAGAEAPPTPVAEAEIAARYDQIINILRSGIATQPPIQTKE